MDQILDQETIRHSGAEADTAGYSPGAIHQAWLKDGPSRAEKPSAAFARPIAPGRKRA